jgi:hypothetical protein
MLLLKVPSSLSVLRKLVSWLRRWPLTRLGMRSAIRPAPARFTSLVDMLTTKIDLLMKKIENPGLDHLKMVNARVMCEECREIGHMGINYPMVSQDVNFVGNSNNGFRPNQGFNARWNKPSFPFNNHQQGGMGQNFNRNEPPLKDIIRNQVRINDEIDKKIHATDKLLENINAKMGNFTEATQNQLASIRCWRHRFSKSLQHSQVKVMGILLRSPFQRV